MTRIAWEPVVERASTIAATSVMTLRQCFYILVTEGVIPNTDTSYKRLSSLTANARREGQFPPFIDGTREIFRYATWDGLDDAIGDAADSYRRDRTAGQPFQIWIGGEKRTLSRQLQQWFGELGFPIVICAGYSSQTLCDNVRRQVESDGRPAALVYAGDFDPSGEDIARDFISRVGVFARVHRVAVVVEQVIDLSLPPLPGKASDSRAAGFMARHGRLVQVEVEAVPPELLRDLYQATIDTVWDVRAFDELLKQEADEWDQLTAFLDRWRTR